MRWEGGMAGSRSAGEFASPAEAMRYASLQLLSFLKQLLFEIPKPLLMFLNPLLS